jgi:hypothetical protein
MGSVVSDVDHGLSDSGKCLFLGLPIDGKTGSRRRHQALLDTLHGATQLIKQLDSARFVVWLNPCWGPIPQQSLTAGLQAAQNSTTLLLEEAARVNAAAVRKSFEEGASRIEHLLAAGRRIAWLSLKASIVALTTAVCAIFMHVIH